VTFAQTWDVSYRTSEEAAPVIAPVFSVTGTAAADTAAIAIAESMPPGLGPASPSSLRQVLLAIGPESAKVARDFTKSTLRDWGLDGLAQEAALIASELVTNAIRHGCADAGAGAGQDERVELSWQRQASRVICMVTDQSPRPPVPGDTDFAAESGRGLQVVAALAATWGWMMLGARCKAVWAALAILPRLTD
jgi:anti-sigma regulatory factor (Ser/Thr protein kinase)